MFRRNQKNAGLGAGGNCVCTSCSHSIPHQRGIACNSLTCPVCGAPMTREGLNTIQNNNNNNNNTGKPTVDADGCIGCGRCLSVCPVNAITMVARKAIIDHDVCIGCNRCIGVCPVNAIK